MKLTPRQQTFLDMLFDLYRELGGPVHYSVVAERLGVNRFSAYDMLKILEEKGVAASSYVLREARTGPGRSMVVFYPTYQATRFLTQLRHDAFNGDEWYRVKENLLGQLQQIKETDYNTALRDILSRLPGIKTPLEYCTEMVSLLLLNLAQATQKADRMISIRALTNLTSEGQVGLGTLAGFSLGSFVSGKADDPTLTEKLMRHTREFQAYLNELSEESVNRLSSFLQDAIKVFAGSYLGNE